MTETGPGSIEIDHDGPEPRVRFTLPQEWFTLPQLRQFAAYLTLVADENEPHEETEELARLLADGVAIRMDHRALARSVLAAGYTRMPAIPSGTGD